MATDLLTTYKYGWKTSYYPNAYDLKSDEIDVEKPLLKDLVNDILQSEEGSGSCSV